MAGLPVGSHRKLRARQAAPGNVPARICSITSCFVVAECSPVRGYDSDQGPFPGAASKQPIDLPTYKAAPLQALGLATRRSRIRPPMTSTRTSTSTSTSTKNRRLTKKSVPNARKKEKRLNTPCCGLSTSLVKAIRVCARFLSTSTPWRAQPGSFFRTIS